MFAPITITAAYVSGSAWSDAAGTEDFEGYLASHGLGNVATPTLGYALKTGADQTTDLPWANVNTISVSFSGAVSDIGLGSLKLVGGTGGGAVAAPTVTGFAKIGNNTYSWTFPTALGNNKYIFAIATTGSSFGTLGSSRVTDANGAGISGTFATGSSAFPSGNGLAGSTFDFSFSILPNDGQQQAVVTSADVAGTKALLNDHETSTGYNPYFDYNGAGIINAHDAAQAAAVLNTKQSGITAPTVPSAEPVGGTGDVVATAALAALALGVQETGSSPASNVTPGPATTTTLGNVVSPSTPPTATTVGNTGSGSGMESGSTSPINTMASQGRHRFVATDAAMSGFDPADSVGFDP